VLVRQDNCSGVAVYYPELPGPKVATSRLHAIVFTDTETAALLSPLFGRRYEEGAIVCKVLMNITLPCGHNLEVPCCDAAKAKGDASYCTREVEVVMPVCGHTITVSISVP
jgi:hypothetical protein